MTGRLEGKVAIITGAGGLGLGRAGALLFAEEGAKIVALDVREEGVEETVRLVREAGGEAVGLRSDITVEAEVERVVEFALSSYGQIDILWNNAAILTAPYLPAEQISLEQWKETFDVNSTGTFLMIKHVVPHFKERRTGVILNTTSQSAIAVISPGCAHYAASKAAVAQLTRWLSAELASFGIRVNSLAGGGIKSPGGVWKGEFVEPEVSPFGDLPLRQPRAIPQTEATRWPTLEEFARGALYLVEPASGPVSGVILAVDGGTTARAYQ